MKALLGWLARKVVLYVLLAVAIAFFTLAWPNIQSGLSIEALRTDLLSPAQLRDEVVELRAQTQLDLNQEVERIRSLGTAEHAQYLARTRQELAEAKLEREAAKGLFPAVRPTTILDRKRLDLRISALEKKIEALEAAGRANRERDALRLAQQNLAPFARIPRQEAVRAAARQCRAAQERVRAFERRETIDRGLRNLFRDERARLREIQQKQCTLARALDSRRRSGLAAAEQVRQAQARYDSASAWTVGQVEEVSSGIGGRTLRNIFEAAAIALAVVIALPYLLRLLFYFVLAPIAERRAAIRLKVSGDADAGIKLPERSGTAASILLKNDEELLVRQGYLQSTSQSGAKSTRWLLDWRHPMSSVASGMIFLTRVRGDGELTTISAVGDPFAEVTVLELSAGGSCVLQPHALAAVAHPSAQPVRITSRWRLTSLNAWLTLQLRYLIFHGPARLVIKGGRGVRVEPATRGRIFGQQQLIGFSAELAYSVRRTETFWPYFFGREQLLKDTVAEGRGLLILEEAPMAGRAGGRVRRGLEGTFDAALKAFGV